jgi:hypothetical protein
MPFENFADLKTALQNDIFNLVDSLGEKYNTQMKESISEIVYQPYSPRVYKRRGENGGFLGSWFSNTSFPGGDLNFMQNEISSDPDSMELVPEDFVHGSSRNVSPGDMYEKHHTDIFIKMINNATEADRRADMPGIIAGGRRYDFVIPAEVLHWQEVDENNWWTRPRDYFSPVITTIDTEFRLDIGSFFKSNHIRYQ